MNIYKCFYYLSFVLHSLSTKGNSNLHINTGLESVTPIGLLFSSLVNNTSEEDIEVSLIPDKCCLELPEDTDCNILEIDGGCTEIIPRGSSKMLKLVAPILDPYERYGHCTVFVDSRRSDTNIITKDKIKLAFDTRVTNESSEADNIKKCPLIDQDPMNDCKPVDCDSYYNGRRPYFDNKAKRCVKIPNCVDRNDLLMPEVIYNPDTNECVEGNLVDQRDIEFIKTITDGKDRQAKDILIIKNYHYGNDTYGGSPITNLNSQGTVVHQKPKCCKWLKYVSHNKYTLTVLSFIVLIQCCLIITLVYCMTQNCICFKKKKVVRKFFNYRQDASVTTPLICTSNIDTDTTEFRYVSESSNNIDKKIKCYKACQKERKDNVKLCMSDDILSKCLTRRDWNRKPQSNTIPEVASDKMDFDNMKKILAETKKGDSQKNTDVKVNFETHSSKPSVKAKESSKHILKAVLQEKEVQHDQCDSSEKELKCHSYHNSGKSNLTGFKPSSYNKNIGMFKTNQSKKGTISLSSEKGAQASFSNDSIDDFLSEKGITFLAENISKYSFSSSSAVRSTGTSASSKTSKNNVFKNIVSLFAKKSKVGPCSDPGVKRSKDSLDLELLHMSRASVFSSSDETGCKGLRTVRDSRTSM